MEQKKGNKKIVILASMALLFLIVIFFVYINTDKTEMVKGKNSNAIKNEEEEACIIHDFERVEEIHAWFQGFHEIGRILDETQQKERNDCFYYPVEQYNIHTMKELEDYVNQYATVEQSQALFAKHEQDIFFEEDGILYTLSGYIGNCDYRDGERSYQIEYDEVNQKASLTISISMEMMNDEIQEITKKYSMFRAENGNWKVQGTFELPIKDF